jgi:hypothetical protein
VAHLYRERGCHGCRSMRATGDKKARPGPAGRGSKPRRRSPNCTLVLQVIGPVGHNAGMANAPNFRLALARVIVPTSGPGAALATLEDAARSVGLLRSWRQGRPHWDFAAELLLRAAETVKRRDVEAATAEMERALRVEGWL